MRNTYATLAGIRRYVGLSAAQTSDDDLLMQLVQAASRLIEGCTGRRFYPLRQARSYTCPGASGPDTSGPDTGFLVLDGDLLSLHTLTNGDGSTISTEALHLLPSGTVVKSGIALDRTQAVFTHTGDPVEAITVDATWGFHPDWPDVWAASGDSVQDDPLSDSATSITVSDADGADASGVTPRFAAGQLIRIEDEYVHVLAVDTDTNTLTVARGANGTTATSHAASTSMFVYQPPADIQQACWRVAAWLYRQKDAGFVRVTGSMRGQVVIPPALPADIQQILEPYRRVRVS
ncbi:MAG: phage gp6-like head-tail connector protein [Anaerolineae bacterium]|nr:phage gp6-like head-tail connector protein [Anaerolineae bacterium]